MSYSAVIGAGFGDEGKGLVTDYLCSKSKNPLVIRFSGGQQAGHTVVFNGVRHVFSNFGSGTLRGVPTYWSKFCTTDPIGVVNELNVLINKGISPELYIDERCPVTTPYDIYRNQNDIQNIKDGSCGVGVGATIQREEMKYSLLFGDLFSPWIFKTKLDSIKEYYKPKQKILLDRFLECVQIIIDSEYVKLSHHFFKTFRKVDFSDYIFEGSQGLLLDQNIGFFPHVTRSNTGTKNVLELCDNPHIYLVTRAYQTRHGNGPMTNENIPHNIKTDPNETNVDHIYQGEFRRSLLDVDLLEYGIKKDKYIRQATKKSLVITCLDHIENEYRFTHKGKIIYCDDENDFIYKISDILNVPNVLTY